MKKSLLICLFFVFSGAFYAQDAITKNEPKKKETTKKKSAYDYDKVVPVKSIKKEATEKSSKAEAVVKKEIKKKKSGYDYGKDVPAKSAAAKESVKAKATKIEKISTEKKKTTLKKAEAKLKESNEKAPKTPDKVTGKYKGKTVYTGSRGGKYYINKNGNKTYIQD